jgi:hypothetical protein
MFVTPLSCAELHVTIDRLAAVANARPPEAAPVPMRRRRTNNTNDDERSSR